MRAKFPHTKNIKMEEEETGACDEGGSRSCPATEESPGILQLIDKLEDVDGTCDEGGSRSCPATEEPLGTIELEDVDGSCDEGGIISSPAPEEPLGILQLIDQLENIVDTLLPG